MRALICQSLTRKSLKHNPELVSVSGTQKETAYLSEHRTSVLPRHAQLLLDLRHIALKINFTERRKIPNLVLITTIFIKGKRKVIQLPRKSLERYLEMKNDSFTA